MWTCTQCILSLRLKLAIITCWRKFISINNYIRIVTLISSMITSHITSLKSTHLSQSQSHHSFEFIDTKIHLLWFGSYVSLSICLITLSQLHVNLLCDYDKPICQPCWERLDWLKRWFCFLFKTDENDLKIFFNVIPWPEKSQGPEEGIGLLTANKISFWKKIPRETCEKFCEIILKNTSLESDLCFSLNKRVGTKVWLVSTKFSFFLLEYNNNLLRRNSNATDKFPSFQYLDLLRKMDKLFLLIGWLTMLTSERRQLLRSPKHTYSIGRVKEEIL